MKKTISPMLTLAKIVFLILLIAAIVLPIYILFNKIPIERSSDLNDYELHRQKLYSAHDFMPELGKITDATEIRYGYQTTNIALWLSRTMALTVQYTPAAYQHVRDEILAARTFLNAPISETGIDGLYYIVDDSFEHNGYLFRTVSEPCSSNYFGIIGTNDAAYSIAYLFFSDTDRDFIAKEDEDLDTAMRDLIDEEFNWKPFRQ